MLDRPDLFIGGQWVVPTHGGTTIIEAATGETLGHAAMAGAPDIDAAVAAARAVLPGWRARPVAERTHLLRVFADSLEARSADTATLVSRENGIPVTRSMLAEGSAPAYVIRYFCGLVESRAAYERRSGISGGDVLIRREPVGVVAAIIP